MDIIIVVGKNSRTYKIGKAIVNLANKEVNVEIDNSLFKNDTNFINHIKDAIINDIEKQKNDISGLKNGLMFFCVKNGKSL